VSSCFLVVVIGVGDELSTRPPGIEYPITVEVGREFFPVGVESSFFNNDAQDFFTGGVAGAGGAGGATSTSVSLSCGVSVAAGISTGTVVEGVGDFKSGGGVLDIEVREDTGEAGVVSWAKGVTAVVSVTGDGESDFRVWTAEGSSDTSFALSRSGSSGMLTAARTGVSGGVGSLSASSTT
jgi:hypothetical protein